MSENRRHYTAAVDLGSNSFHMIVAEVRDGQLQIIDRLREMVQLADGLDEKNNLSAEARDRAITCLRQFGQRLQGIPGSRIRAVGTNALRQAKNGVEFQRSAERALGHPIEIISGREEARLVYLGVSHNITDPDSRQLVIDIGGGSTELIIGQHHQPLLTESLLLGCISYTKKYFADGAVTRARVNAARRDAELEFAPIESAYQEMGWQRVIGSSGTVKALAELAHAHGLCTEGLMTRSALETLTEQLITAGRAEPLAQGEVSPRRLSVLPGGLCVLRAAMERLEFETLHVSDQALREGLLYDFLERIQHHDIRNHTVSNMATRYHLDTTHADLVKQSALALFDQLQPESGLNEADRSTLAWASSLHELGLSIAHNQYHKHGEYVLRYADLPGFSRDEQNVLALLVRAHRRKLPASSFKGLPDTRRESTLLLALLLRLAVLLHRSRRHAVMPLPNLKWKSGQMQIGFPPGWLENHPLTEADLELEQNYLNEAGFKLSFS